MNDVVIRADGLGKKYVIGHERRDGSETFREMIINRTQGVLRSTSDLFRGRALIGGAEREEFWALRDIDFEIKRGDVVGIIGRNGAGKSTLLKILSRITEPTEGRISIRGRVASLLEVGTGFHPELTGRENIYLNGAILGMSRAEIRRKFDEIVDFAEVARFLDTPVKRYSSGMYVRLAFAVAAHLEPEILIVDEVLAVGDAEFQKKCLGKMSSVAGHGRTVLFVSHNMSAIQRLCRSCMLFRGGRLQIATEDVRYVTSEYLKTDWNSPAEWRASDEENLVRPVEPLSMRICDRQGQTIEQPLTNREDFYFRCNVRIDVPDPALTLGFALYAEGGELLFWSYASDGAEEDWPHLGRGRVTLQARLPGRFLNEGRYRLEFISSLHQREWYHEPGSGPSISFSIVGGLSDSPLWPGRRPGYLAPVIDWQNTEDLTGEFYRRTASGSR